jgi:putative nucleotidyltransferase with HDIG domain
MSGADREPRYDRAQVRARIEGMSTVRTIPAVVSRIAAMLDSGSVSAVDIAEEISTDQVLAAKVLKLVNSGFYAFRSPITTISHAMVLLGFDVVRTFVLTASVLDLAEAMHRLMAGLWEHSLATARAARAIAERSGLGDHEEIALVGLLHDIGKVLIAQAFPAEFDEIRRVTMERGCLQLEAETAVLGVGHPEVGAWLLRKWSLPSKMVMPIAHHSSFHPRRDYADRTAVVHLADILSRAKGIGHPGDRRIPRLDPEAWALLGLTMADVDVVCRQLDEDMADVFFG